MEHQDTKLTSMRPRLKELNDNPYLGTHALFPEHIRQFILTNNYFSNQITIDLIVFFSTILLCSLFCWILLKTVPYLIAQKELIYFRNLHEN